MLIVEFPKNQYPTKFDKNHFIKDLADQIKPKSTQIDTKPM